MCSFCKRGVILTGTPLTVDRNSSDARRSCAGVMFTEAVSPARGVAVRWARGPGPSAFQEGLFTFGSRLRCHVEGRERRAAEEGGQIARLWPHDLCYRSDGIRVDPGKVCAEGTQMTPVNDLTRKRKKKKFI